MIRFRTFGSVELTGEEGTDYSSVLARPKILGLLSYLAGSTPPGFHRRDTLLGLFWAELDQDRARKALRQSLYQLRQAFGDGVVVGRGDDEVGLSTSLFWSDVVEFEALLEREEPEEALDLYQGDFLPGFFVSDAPEFESWLDLRRTQLCDAAASAAWTLAEQGLKKRNPAGAAYWGRRAVSLAPLDERLLRRLISLLDRVGDRAGAVREYELFARRLDEELELEPAPETRALMEDVRSRSQIPPDRVTAAPAEGQAEPDGKEAASVNQAHLVGPTVAAGRRLDSRRWLWPVVVAIALTAVLILQRAVFPSNDSAGEAAVAEVLLRDRPSVAVLPFDNLSPNAEDAYLADGMHEEILTRLSKVSGLIVISRSSVLRYRDHGLTGPQIAAELSVSALLEGSVQKAGNQIKITAQLIDGETDAHLWGESYDRDFSIENLFDVQSEIAFRIAENLRAILNPLEEIRITNAPTENLRAYELYLRGRRSYDLYQSGENASAIELYRQAIGLDSSFAAAWAALGDAYAQGILLFGLESTWWDSALAVSQRAISLNADRADGFKALGLVHMSRGSYRPALEALLQALEIEPNHPTAAANISVVLMRFGSLDESLLWNRRALSVAPNHTLIRANMAWSYLALGELDIARQKARETIAMEQGMAHAHWALSAVAAARGDYARALEIAERVIEIDPDSPARRQFAAEIALFARDLVTAGQHSRAVLDMNLGGSIPPWHFPGTTLGYVLRQRGEIERAGERLQDTRAAVQQLIASGADDPRLPWEIGCMHAIQGEVDEALVWLERGFREGWRWTIEVESDPLLDTVRGSPRFARLVSEMAADVETMRRRALQPGTSAHLR